MLVHPSEGEPFDRVPAWVPVAWKDEDSGLLNGVVWHPPQSVSATCCRRFGFASSGISEVICTVVYQYTSFFGVP